MLIVRAKRYRTFTVKRTRKFLKIATNLSVQEKFFTNFSARKHFSQIFLQENIFRKFFCKKTFFTNFPDQNPPQNLTSNNEK